MIDSYRILCNGSWSVSSGVWTRSNWLSVSHYFFYIITDNPGFFTFPWSWNLKIVFSFSIPKQKPRKVWLISPETNIHLRNWGTSLAMGNGNRTFILFRRRAALPLCLLHIINGLIWELHVLPYKVFDSVTGCISHVNRAYVHGYHTHNQNCQYPQPY